MLKAIRRAFALATIIPTSIMAGVVGTLGTVPVDAKDWARAVGENSLEAYADFILTHPESHYTNKAHERLLGFENAGAPISQTAEEKDGPAAAEAPVFDSIMVV